MKSLAIVLALSAIPVALFGKQGVTSYVEHGNWTLMAQTDVIEGVPLSAALFTPPVKKDQPLGASFGLSCPPFRAATAVYGRHIIEIRVNKYDAPAAGQSVNVALRFDQNAPIRFSAASVGSGDVRTGDPDLWDQVLGALPTASSLGMEVYGDQALLDVRGFDDLGNLFLKNCAAMKPLTSP
jgi:hypothetical protein